MTVLSQKVTESTALGAAYLAGLATCFWADADELTAHWAMDKTFVPELSVGARADKLARWQQAIERSRAWAAV